MKPTPHDEQPGVHKLFNRKRKLKPDAGPAAPPGSTVPAAGHEDLLKPADLPPECPVVPLGKLDTRFFFLDRDKQVIGLSARELQSRNYISALFGEDNYLLASIWPRRNRDNLVNGIDVARASDSLMRACSQAGIWDPAQRVRQRGAWPGPEGELVLHLGDQLLIVSADGTPARPAPLGRYASHVYPRVEAGPRPSLEPTGIGQSGAGPRVLRHLSGWAWRRGELDARLMLGQLTTAMIGGALPWRAHVWVTGTRGAGKSTLHAYIKALHEDAVTAPSDTTAAGLWQTLQHSSEPLYIDEAEAAEDNRKNSAITQLARIASSSGEVRRGGADHRSVSFTVRSSFAFLSINMPPLLSQDRSRLAMLELFDRPRDVSLDVPALLTEARKLGPRLRRRLVDTWPRYAATLQLYRAALSAVGHSPRAADQFGTLLCGADLVLHDGLPDPEFVSELASQLAPGEIAEVVDDVPDELACLQHLMTFQIDPFRRGRKASLGEWIQWAAEDPPPAGEFGDPAPADDDSARPVSPEAANRVLASFGVKVVRDAGGRLPWLAIANAHSQLAAIYQGTHWASRSGAIGVWSQALRRLEGAQRSEKPVRFGAVTARSTLLPVDHFAAVGGGA